MNIELLKQFGLTDSQARTYLALIRAGSLTPPQLAKLTNDNRTAAYMALAKLEELGLANVNEEKAGKTYEPASPSALQALLDKRKQELEAIDKTYRDSLSNMLSYYFEKQSKPGVKFFSGMDGLEEIYKDHHKTGGHIQVVRTTADLEFGEMLYRYLDKGAQLGITLDVLGPAWPEAIDWANKNKNRHNRINSWVPVEYYTAPVEICVYSDKVSMISFAKETVGIIIESPQIAESMRQLYKLAKIGGETLMQRRKAMGSGERDPETSSG